MKKKLIGCHLDSDDDDATNNVDNFLEVQDAEFSKKGICMLQDDWKCINVGEDYVEEINQVIKYLILYLSTNSRYWHILEYFHFMEIYQNLNQTTLYILERQFNTQTHTDSRQ